MTEFALPSPMLVIEASSKRGSIAVIVDGQVEAQTDVPMGASSVDELFPAVQATLAACSVLPLELRAIACGAGPGSFTSLRIAASICKGLAHGTGAELYAVPSLLLALGEYAITRPRGDTGTHFVVHADALRGERFALHAEVGHDGAVRASGEIRRVSLPELDAISALDSHAEGGARLMRIAVASSPSPEREHAIVHPTAAAVMRVADWASCGPVSLDAWEPVYGRLAEAQVVWERKHGHALPTA